MLFSMINYDTSATDARMLAFIVLNKQTMAKVTVCFVTEGSGCLAT